MKHEFTTRDAKARLSELLDLAAIGAEVEITRQGAKRGRFRLVAMNEDKPYRRPGTLKGRIRIPDDFDAEDPDIVADFEG